MTKRVLIVGGGLSGLHLASRCQQHGLEFQLVEARTRLGGRILDHQVTHAGRTAHFDLGPAWHWPGQPRIAELAARLKLASFQQYARGTVSYEDEKGQVFRGRGFSSMQGACRLVGGVGSLIRALAAEIDIKRVRLCTRATAVRCHGEVLETVLESDHGSNELFDSEFVVLAVPPRVIAETINLDTILGEDELQAMRMIPTWMAGHAKIVAVYRQAFWRAAGLSGDASSRRGPMVEIHDASPQQDGPYGLFGFVGVPAEIRSGQGEALIEHARIQLGRIFGEAALDPINISLQDWATEKETASSLDAVPMGHHPEYGLPPELMGLCKGRLIMASTEAATEFGGYLEGALGAADSALNQILRAG